MFSKTELENILSSHVARISQHYDGQLISLDSANEGYLGCGPWCTLGTNNYVRISFEAAHELYLFTIPDGPTCIPTIPLIYNSIFFNREEEDKALSLLDTGTIDGIGIQLHLTSTEDWQGALNRADNFLNRVRKHGGWARLSEIGVWASSEEEQAEIYQAITVLAIRHSDIVRDFVVWGVKDPSWRGDVTLFDVNGQPKLAYYAIIEELTK